MQYQKLRDYCSSCKPSDEQAGVLCRECRETWIPQRCPIYYRSKER